MPNTPPPLTPLEFDRADFPRAERFARHLGYRQTAYTSSSALWGLFCLPENPATAKHGEATRGGCIIKTREFGLMFVQDEEDAGVPAPSRRSVVRR
jgi:hypothetical protein